MLNGNNKKNLIIVCDAKTKKHGEALLQLVSIIDAKKQSTVGIKDGGIIAVLWDEKHYTANSPSLTSLSPVLFIGNSKFIKSKSANMKDTFSKFGMHFLTLGSRAVARVDDRLLKKEEYEEFLSLCAEYQQKCVEYQQNLESEMSIENKIAQTLESHGVNVDAKTIEKITRISMFLSLSLVPASWTILTALSNEKKMQQEIDQEYAFLMLYIYMKLLTDFLGID